MLFFSTGTGEAPHNAMVVELLARATPAPFSLRCLYASGPTWATPRSTVNSSRYANYTYLPMPTREPDVPKRYIQNLISDGVIEGELGLTLDPENTHVFLCGNPSMIGLPEDVDGETVFPKQRVLLNYSPRGAYLGSPQAAGEHPL
ncbi:MAG: hypothetical protein R2735_04720 [Microthrixaceae bacterium]